MEVLKWSDAGTVLRVASTSQVWRQVCNSQELWLSLLEAADFSRDEAPSIFSPKAAFRVINALRKQKRCVMVDASHISLYNCTERRWVQSWEKNALPGNKYCAAVLLSYYQVLLCGGGCRDCTLFECRSGEVQTAPAMLHVRSYHSAVVIDKSVYVFGAFQWLANRAAEVYYMSIWSPLPNMITGRYYFNACVKDKSVYLCGGHTPKCEVFNSLTKTFRPLPQDLGPTFLVVSFFYRDELVSLIGGKIYYHQKNRIRKEDYQNVLVP